VKKNFSLALPEQGLMTRGLVPYSSKTTEPTDLFDGSPKPIKKVQLSGVKTEVKALYKNVDRIYIYTKIRQLPVIGGRRGTVAKTIKAQVKSTTHHHHK
jgi:hypothetical protein